MPWKVIRLCSGSRLPEDSFQLYVLNLSLFRYKSGTLFETLSKSPSLSVSEVRWVRVFIGKVQTSWLISENVALNKTCSLSSKWDETVKPDNAVNGNTDGDFNSKNCIHTANSDRDAWWEVDLGRTYPVQSITIWARDPGKDWPLTAMGQLIRWKVCWSWVLCSP